MSFPKRTIESRVWYISKNIYILLFKFVSSFLLNIRLCYRIERISVIEKSISDSFNVLIIYKFHFSFFNLVFYVLSTYQWGKLRLLITSQKQSFKLSATICLSSLISSCSVLLSFSIKIISSLLAILPEKSGLIELQNFLLLHSISVSTLP